MLGKGSRNGNRMSVFVIVLLSSYPKIMGYLLQHLKIDILPPWCLFIYIWQKGKVQDTSVI